jgi:polysaccharide pyruvyl transferase WcaK-like protein
MLYATSAGPFQKKWANPFRRYTYRCFSRLFVREEISAGHIRGLLAGRRHGVNVEVSIDSALQVAIAPQERQHADAQLIVVSAIHWPYPNDPSPQLRQKEYDTSVIEAVKIFAESGPTHVVFVPQLYGSMHRDTPYLEALASLLPANISCEVLSDTKSSNEQRALFAAADWVVAGRYHPAVFAVSAAVPVLCIAYEHKATGVLQAAGVPDAVMSIDEVTVEVVQAKARELLAARANLSARLQVAQVALREVSSRTSGAVAELVRRSMK